MVYTNWSAETEASSLQEWFTVEDMTRFVKHLSADDFRPEKFRSIAGNIRLTLEGANNFNTPVDKDRRFCPTGAWLCAGIGTWYGTLTRIVGVLSCWGRLYAHEDDLLQGGSTRSILRVPVVGKWEDVQPRPFFTDVHSFRQALITDAFDRVKFEKTFSLEWQDTKK